ncbi:MAG TPA: hypothetical protein VFR66_08310 [Burkholderiales bacterium]|nr:hypothetical protein [Burkholderiales bacterium]
MLIGSVVMYLLLTIGIGLWAAQRNVPGAVLSVVLGLLSWTIAEAVAPESTVPPQLVGLGFSIAGMVLGSFVPSPAAAPAHHHGKH